MGKIAISLTSQMADVTTSVTFLNAIMMGEIVLVLWTIMGNRVVRALLVKYEGTQEVCLHL